MAYLGRKGATAALASADLPTNSITTSHIVANAVTSAKIGVDVIVAEDIAANAITVSEIQDDAVTAAKLANSINTDIALGVAALPKAGGTMSGNIVMADDTSIGIGDSAERIEFDGAGDISFLGCNVGIGTSAPSNDLHIYDSDSHAGLRIDAGSTTYNSELEFCVGDVRKGRITYDHNSTDADGSFQFYTGGDTDTVRLTIDGSGKVGIGTAAPDCELHVLGGGSPSIRITDSTNTVTGKFQSTNSVSKIGTHTNHAFEIYTNNTTRLAIDTSGNVGINRTASIQASLHVVGNQVLTGTLYLGSYNGGWALQSGGASGTTAGNTLYWANTQLASASDERIKKNIVDSELNAVETLLKIRIVDFEWNDPSQEKATLTGNDKNARGKWTGFIAQEAVEHIPTMIEAPRKDGVIDHESEALWIVDPSASIPILMKAIQELSAKVTALEAA